MSNLSPSHQEHLKQCAGQFKDALFAMAALNQKHNPYITDGHIIVACSRLIGELIKIQSLPRAEKEKLALNAFTSVQNAAGLLEAPEKTNG